MNLPSAIEGYFAPFPEPIRKRLLLVRETIKSVAPESSEKISYGMPTFFLKKNLVHFA